MSGEFWLPREIATDQRSLHLIAVTPALRRPFTADAVRFKVQTTWGPSKDADRTGGLIVPYIDARLVTERLNLLVPGLWSETFVRDGHDMWCHLTIDGTTHSDVGNGSSTKAMISDSRKRAAVPFGIGRSLYAIPKIMLNVGEYLRAKRVDGKPSAVLTPNGETHCRDLYTSWLEVKGIEAFGRPYDHGDAPDALGDEQAAAEAAEAAEGEDEGGGADAPAEAAQQPQGRPVTESEPTTNGKAPEAEAPPESAESAALRELLAKRSPLSDKRAQANAGMERLGAPAAQRLRELEGAMAGKDLDALVKRVEAAVAARFPDPPTGQASMLGEAPDA